MSSRLRGGLAAAILVAASLVVAANARAQQPAAPAAPAAQTPPSTLDVVRQRGAVRCSASPGIAGFSQADAQGNWAGLDIDMCRAIAAAVLGDASKIQVVSTTAAQRFTALQSGEVDFLARNSSWNLTRDVSLGVHFLAVNFYDGQAFLVPRRLGLHSVRDLNGATICTATGTTTEVTTAAYFRANNLRFTPVVIENVEGAIAAYLAGRCDAYTGDLSGLAGVRRTRAANPDDHVILPEIISKEPFGIAVRQGDGRWGDVVRWSFYAMLEAEELGLTTATIDAALDSNDPAVQRFVGNSGNLGQLLGLDRRWAYAIVKQVGNYGESFARNLAPLGIDRGVNRLWRDGGLMYAPQFQ
jgi:general L-amino acid transport system substrate-binding protein